MTQADPKPEESAEEDLPGKHDIKSWLRKNEIDRFWLAEQCGVNKRTVDNWLSSPRTIPLKAHRIISRLIQDFQPTPAGEVLQNLVLEVDEVTFDRWCRAALERHMTLKEWAIDALDRAAKCYTIETPEPVLMVAESVEEMAEVPPPPDGKPPLGEGPM